jgi:hypothetical protein
VTLASAVENGDTFGGVTLATGNIVALLGQTSATENGVYTVNASGAPTRIAALDASGELVVGQMVSVTAGTEAGRTYYVSATGATPWVPGSSTSTWTLLTGVTGATGPVGVTGPTGVTGATGPAPITALNAISSSPYTIVSSDVNKLVTLANVASVVLPQNSTAAVAVGESIHFQWVSGAGQPVFSAGSGATLSPTPYPGAKLAAVGAVCTATKVATNTWTIYGGLVA